MGGGVGVRGEVKGGGDLRFLGVEVPTITISINAHLLIMQILPFIMSSSGIFQNTFHCQKSLALQVSFQKNVSLLEDIFNAGNLLPLNSLCWISNSRLKCGSLTIKFSM